MNKALRGWFAAVLLGAMTVFGSGRDWEWDYTGEGSTWAAEAPL